MAYYRHPERPGKLLWHKPGALPTITRYPSIAADGDPSEGDTVTITRAAFGGVSAAQEALTLNGADVMGDATDNNDGTYSYVLNSPLGSDHLTLEYVGHRPGFETAHKARITVY